jgi:hypothetical protein
MLGAGDKPAALFHLYRIYTLLDTDQSWPLLRPMPFNKICEFVLFTKNNGQVRFWFADFRRSLAAKRSKICPHLAWRSFNQHPLQAEILNAMEATIEFAPAIPFPVPFDVQKRIQELRGYLDPNNC